MGVESKEEWDEQVVSVLESLEGLLPDLCMSGGKHQQHAEKHHMPSNTANLSVVYLYGRLLSYLRQFDVEKAAGVSVEIIDGPTVDLLDVVSRNMENGVKE